MKQIELEILRFSYYEHIKSEKELSLILEPTHSKRILIHQEAKNILRQIKQLLP